MKRWTNGTPITALTSRRSWDLLCGRVADGVVSAVKEDPMWGTVVEITHEEDLISRYCGLDEELSVVEGQAVPSLTRLAGWAIPTWRKPPWNLTCTLSFSKMAYGWIHWTGWAFMNQTISA